MLLNIASFNYLIHSCGTYFPGACQDKFFQLLTHINICAAVLPDITCFILHSKQSRGYHLNAAPGQGQRSRFLFVRQSPG